MLRVQGGRGENVIFIFLSNFQHGGVCVVPTLKLSMTVAVQITPAVSSLLAFETMQAALKTTGTVSNFFSFFADFKPEHTIA